MRRSHRAAVIVVVLALGVWGSATPASAATCSFTAPVVTIDVGGGETATVGRSGDAITLNGAPCGTATVGNTDTIAIATTGVPTEIGIDLSGGPLAPGLTTEPDGPEIEITVNAPNGVPTLRVVGSADADHVAAGAPGINLNADEPNPDVDVTVTGTPALVVEGRDGDDALSLRGTGAGAAGVAGTLLGGAGDDELSGGVPGSTFDGGDGTDLVDYSGATALQRADLRTGQVTHAAGGTDTLAAIEDLTGSPGDDLIVGGPGDNAIDGGDGTDAIDFSTASAMDVDLRAGRAIGDGMDRLTGVEDVIGSPSGDRIVGDGAANLVDGAAGDDTVGGAAGDDTLVGGDGDDTVTFQPSDEGVTVSLKKGTADGEGADTLEGFENVIGSRRPDEIRGDGGNNRLNGRRGADRLSGAGGGDILVGGDGNDVLSGQRDRDALLGEAGKDRLDGGKDRDTCNGGPGPDSFVFCERIRVGPGVARGA